MTETMVGITPGELCAETVYWWDGEYEGECELARGHAGDHWDGVSWFNDDRHPTDDDHDGPPSKPERSSPPTSG